MGERTNLGPLTTAFKVPESCQLVIPECTNCTVGWKAQTCSDNKANTQGVQDNADCWPARDNPYLSTKAAFGGWGFYSPGLSCPVGYATSCSATAGANDGFTFQFSLTKGETAIGCCPSGYQCYYNRADKRGQTCYSVAKTVSFSTASCSSGKSNDVGLLQMPATITSAASGEASQSTIDEFTIYAPLYQLNFQRSDLSTSTASASSSPGDHSTGGGLSTGIRAGIGACVGGIALSILGVSFFLLYRRKKKHSPFPRPPNPEDFGKPELQTKETQQSPMDTHTPARVDELP